MKNTLLVCFSLLFSFYTSFAMDNEKQEATQLCFYAIEKSSPHYELLFRYIRHIDFATRNEAVHYSHVFDDIPGHAWYSLLNPVLCGS